MARLSRVPFVVAAALLGVGIADPTVESIANTGILGGRYADNNHVGVAPTLVLAAIAVLTIVASRCRAEWLGRSGNRANAWLSEAGKAIAAGSSLKDFPYVFCLQIAALFVLESLEQLAGGGKLLGGWAWLGGPILFSLTAHAVFAAGATLALRAIVRALVRAFAAIVLTAIRWIWLAIARAATGPARVRDRETPALRAQSPHVRQIGGRAPPQLLPTAA